MSQKTKTDLKPQFDKTISVDDFNYEDIKRLCNHRINMEFVYKSIVVLCKDNNLDMTDNGYFVQSVGDNVNVFSQNQVYKTCFRGFNLSKKDKREIEQCFKACIDITPLLEFFKVMGVI